MTRRREFAYTSSLPPYQHATAHVGPRHSPTFSQPRLAETQAPSLRLAFTAASINAMPRAPSSTFSVNFAAPNPSTAVAWTIVSAPNAEQLEVGRAIGAGRREIVEHAIRHLDDVVGDELSALARGDFGMLQAAFPFVHRPAFEVVSRELGEDRLEIDLAVAERPVAPGALEPAFVAAVDALLRRRIELGVLDVEHLDAIAIGVDEAEIVEALLDEVARGVVDGAALVPADRV